MGSKAGSVCFTFIVCFIAMSSSYCATLGRNPEMIGPPLLEQVMTILFITNHQSLDHHDHNLYWKVIRTSSDIDLIIAAYPWSLVSKAEGDGMPLFTFETRPRFCFILVPRDENEIFFTLSHGSRRDWEFLSINFKIRDEIKICQWKFLPLMSTFTFFQLVSKHCARMRTVSPEIRWKWK